MENIHGQKDRHGQKDKDKDRDILYHRMQDSCMPHECTRKLILNQKQTILTVFEKFKTKSTPGRLELGMT